MSGANINDEYDNNINEEIEALEEFMSKKDLHAMNFGKYKWAIVFELNEASNDNNAVQIAEEKSKNLNEESKMKKIYSNEIQNISSQYDSNKSVHNNDNKISDSQFPYHKMSSDLFDLASPVGYLPSLPYPPRSNIHPHPLSLLGKEGTMTSNFSGVRGSLTSDVSGVGGSMTSNIIEVGRSMTSDVSGIGGSMTSNVSGVEKSMTCSVNEVKGCMKSSVSGVDESRPYSDSGVGQSMTSIVSEVEGGMTSTVSDEQSSFNTLSVVSDDSKSITDHHYPSTVTYNYPYFNININQFLQPMTFHPKGNSSPNNKY